MLIRRSMSQQSPCLSLKGLVTRHIVIKQDIGIPEQQSVTKRQSLAMENIIANIKLSYEFLFMKPVF